VSARREIEVLAAIVHAILAVLHLLGLVFNVRRRNRLDSVAHAAGVLYDGMAAVGHARSAAREES
jgi:putative copper export protein